MLGASRASLAATSRGLMRLHLWSHQRFLPSRAVALGGFRAGRSDIDFVNATYEVCNVEPVSRRVLRLARTAGQPSEMPWRTELPGSNPSWTTVSFATPCPTSSMSKGHLGSGFRPPGVSGGFVHADLGGPFGRNRVPGVAQPAAGIGLEDHLFGVAFTTSPTSSCAMS